MAIHKYDPKIYHAVLGQFEPVLRISDGDTVITSTVDNAGHNALDQKVAEGINPQTGPFYIDGANPGDTLAIHFDKMAPNRKVGRAAVKIAPNVVDPQYIAELPKERIIYEWELDVDKWTATLINPDPQLGNYVLPLSPMIGCFGVAPMMNQGIAATTASTHGGNMDYNGFGAGVTVYFPVYVPGALFFLGDGHVVQGDGEITGMGIECSFDVQFTAKVIKGKGIGNPRAENDKYIMTAGNAKPLDQALQLATTEMIKWLKSDYGLGDNAIGVLLGQCVKYDVGNIFDPAYTMICKLNKRMLDDIL
ncbi:MAG: acetamidase/formamidase family protein [Candidatus Poribacteria bacterium]